MSLCFQIEIERNVDGRMAKKFPTFHLEVIVIDTKSFKRCEIDAAEKLVSISINNYDN